jgi:hypothetical protein
LLLPLLLPTTHRTAPARSLYLVEQLGRQSTAPEPSRDDLGKNIGLENTATNIVSSSVSLASFVQREYSLMMLAGAHCCRARNTIINQACGVSVVHAVHVRT